MLARVQSEPIGRFHYLLSQELAAVATEEELAPIARFAPTSQIVLPVLAEAEAEAEPAPAPQEDDAPTVAHACWLIWMGFRLFWMCLSSLIRMSLQDLREAVSRRVHSLRTAYFLALFGWAGFLALAAIHFWR